MKTAKVTTGNGITPTIRLSPSVESLIERGGELDVSIKRLSEELDGIKSAIREIGDGEYVGENYAVKVIPKTTTTVDPAKFLAAYEAGKVTRGQLLRAISVSVTSARELLGEKSFVAASTVETGTSSVKFAAVSR